MRSWFIFVLTVLVFPALAAERKFEFSETQQGQTPPGFRSTLTGQGKPGDWRVLLDEAPSSLPALNPQAPAVTKRVVLGQVSRDPTDEHFPLLIFDGEVFGDFTLTTKFKTISGQKEQMAGMAFRLQNETNYYVVRASSLGGTFRFYKVVNGVRSQPLGPTVPIPSGVWHELSITCKGNQIRCLLNGKELIPPLTDNSFLTGKIGFWTKSDSVSYFCDTVVHYTPREVPAQTLVHQAIKRYPRLLGLKIYVAGADTNTTRVIASNEAKELGSTGGKTEQAVIGSGQVYYGKEKDSVSVIAPLRDRNGEPIAAARVIMKPFAGQTEQNAIVRAMPVVKSIQEQVQTMQDLVE